MRKLFLFLARYSIVGLFLLLEIVSFSLFLSNDTYPRSVFFSSSNSVASRAYYIGSYISDFFNLRPENEILSKENADLKNKIAELENKLAIVDSENLATSHYINPEKEYKFVPAKIINNTTSQVRNFITLNKGEIDGIHPDMGVVNAEGVVGIVKTVSSQFSTVISVLNPMVQISSKIVRNNYCGPLVWNGADYRYANLTDIPRHVELYIGDSIVTSGLTMAFPENTPIGIIENFTINEGDAFYSIKVRLAVNFRTISNVNVFDYINRREQIMLENQEY